MSTLEIQSRSHVEATIADRDALLAFLSDRAGGRPVVCPLCDAILADADVDPHLGGHRRPAVTV